MPSALASDSLGVSHLIRAYQVNGHHAAKLDPLNLYARESFPNRPSTLAISSMACPPTSLPLITALTLKKTWTVSQLPWSTLWWQQRLP
mmetsp:Transcript_16201/g.23796  ORF Transcript_16201/g.23796 Transcript_16201/m.23796 type:complete len:89 (-) Transcript_16201:75-341(-)